MLGLKKSVNLTLEWFFLKKATKCGRELGWKYWFGLVRMYINIIIHRKISPNQNESNKV